MFELREYQEASVERSLAATDRPIECAPTGSGKTVIQAFIAKRALDAGDGTAILTPRVEIFRQSHSVLQDVCGVNNVTTLSATTRNWNPYKPVHIVSWPTLIARKRKSDAWFPDVRRVLVDEAHLSWPPGCWKCWNTTRPGPL